MATQEVGEGTDGGKNAITLMPQEMISESLYKIIMCQASKGEVNSRKYIRAVIEANGDMFQLSMYTKKQVFHSNFEKSELKSVIDGLFGVTFMQFHAWDGDYEHSAKVSKKGKLLTSRKKTATSPPKTKFAAGGFNRQKNYIIAEGELVPALVDMGVFTKEGKVAGAMGDKFGQINRFLELLADETEEISEDTIINIVDFGCGKSYLTFLVYHYFAEIRKLTVNICGMDLDAHVVQRCTTAAEKYGYTSLRFVQGDIGKQAAPPVEGWGSEDTFNIVISLHACDTATDYALYNAIDWGADLICAVPCCQHELKKQMKSKNLAIFNRYGVIKERIASLATDAIRANLLECCGYKSQIIEFIDMEHTPKNLLIRARKRVGKGIAAAWGEVEGVIDELTIEPTLVNLLREGGYLR